MVDVLNSKILTKANLIINLSGNDQDIKEAINKISKILNDYIDNITFNYTYENLYEYTGINSLYEEANKNPNNIYLYFHSKGMFFHDNNGLNRLNEEKQLLNIILSKWKEVINIFNSQTHINKVCIGCSPEGFCWYNFFWVRGKYLLNCKKPIISNDRYYYEMYIGFENKNSSHNDCYNLIENNSKDFYTMDDIIKAPKQ